MQSFAQIFNRSDLEDGLLLPTISGKICGPTSTNRKGKWRRRVRMGLRKWGSYLGKSGPSLVFGPGSLSLSLSGGFTPCRYQRSSI